MNLEMILMMGCFAYSDKSPNAYNSYFFLWLSYFACKIVFDFWPFLILFIVVRLEKVFDIGFGNNFIFGDERRQEIG